jgi:choline dehydrogenase-like flavoprotein
VSGYLFRHRTYYISVCRGTRAIGVEYVDDTIGRSKNGTPEISFVKASRLVVVSAGAFGSPAILERYDSSTFTNP